jgi:hypothetical protein
MKELEGELRCLRSLCNLNVFIDMHFTFNDVVSRMHVLLLIVFANVFCVLAEAHPSPVPSNDALKLAPNEYVREVTGLALARAGDLAASEKLVAELNKEFPLDTILQRYWLPTIRAAIALDRKDPKRAIELLQDMGAIELSQSAFATTALCPAYIRGQAYLMLHDGKAATAEFQKFIDHRGLVANFPWAVLARLGLARAYALNGATDPAARDKARAAYNDFLTLWKDADSDVPVLMQAKTEYAKLQ